MSSVWHLLSVIEKAKGDKPGPAPAGSVNEAAKGDKSAPQYANDEPKSEWYRALISGSKRTYALMAAGVATALVAINFVPEQEGHWGVLMRALMAFAALFVALSIMERVRRAVAPYIDLRALVDTAKTEPIGAAIVVLAMLYFSGTVLVGVLNVFVMR